MDPELDLKNLRTLVWDCHNPVFYMDQKYETWREENMRANYWEAVELIRAVDSLKEVVLILDWRPGSKVWEFVRELNFGRLKLVEGGKADGEEGPLGYVLRTLRWVAE